MSELERDLHALRDEIAWPETPALRPAYHARGRFRLRLRPLAIALAVLFVVLAGVLALSPGARSAFLEIFRIRGATVVRVDELPEVAAERLDLGRRVTREEAERLVGFRLVDVGPPDGIYVRDGTASLVYGQTRRPRLVLTQGRGMLWDGLVKKVGATDTRVESVSVHGAPALFVSGGQHFVMFIDEHGRLDDERTFLAGTVLLWNRGDLLLRLEGDLTRDEAVELAESVQ